MSETLLPDHPDLVDNTEKSINEVCRHRHEGPGGVLFPGVTGRGSGHDLRARDPKILANVLALRLALQPRARSLRHRDSASFTRKKKLAGMNLYLRKVVHPQAHDNYRVVLKRDGDEFEIGSIGVQFDRRQRDRPGRGN